MKILLNLGKALNKAEQQNVVGGTAAAIDKGWCAKQRKKRNDPHWPCIPPAG